MAKKAFSERMKRAWFKPENTPSCAVIASILGFDKRKKREQLERHLREEARKSRRKGMWVDHVLQLLLSVIHLEVGQAHYEVDVSERKTAVVTLGKKVTDELKDLVD